MFKKRPNLCATLYLKLFPNIETILEEREWKSMFKERPNLSVTLI